MKILAGGMEIPALRIWSERKWMEDVARPVLRVELPGALTQEALTALTAGSLTLANDDGTALGTHTGYTTVASHELTLAQALGTEETQVANALADARASRNAAETALATAAQRLAQLNTLSERFEELRNTQAWSDIELNGNITEGTQVRYLLRTYVCTQAHAKSLLRTPTNGTYWQEVQDDG